MADKELTASENASSHFTRRAQKYNRSSQWVDDQTLINKIRELAAVTPEGTVLDLAIGTGKIAQAFFRQVKCVIGVDICQDMVRQAKDCADKVVLTPAEKLPFPDNMFDACVCRQGLQFMRLEEVLPEVRRVLKPGGRVVFCHLTAYGPEDQKETFLIQQLRNPARKNFFLPEDISRLLRKFMFTGIENVEYITRESVNQWIDNGAITDDAKEKIRETYRNAPAVFKRIHAVQFENGDIWDSMKMVLVTASK